MTKSFSGLLVKVSLLISSLATIHYAYAETNNISLAQVTKDVSYLASDALKGRHNYSTEIHLAADYIAKRFKENGLVGKEGSSRSNFLQKYQVTKITPQTLNLTINGEKISPNRIAMASTEISFSWEMSNNVKKNGFEIHNIGLNDDMRATVSELNHQGGKHLILLNPAHKTVFDRYQHYFQQGTARLAQQDIQKNVGGVIVIALSTITTEKVDSLTITGMSTISQSELVNVVGILPGTTKPEEIVLYSAHYDHLGVNNDRGNDIYNGADDNASGTTAIINLAQYYAKQGDNQRTLMFAAFSAEEIGGFGSSYFSKQHDPQTITAMINIEMIGKPSKFGAGTIWMTGMERSTLGDQLNTVLANSGKSIYKDPYPEQGLFYRSDNATLARLGVPAHSFSSTQLDNDEHYHQTSDDLSSLNLTSLHQVIKTLAKATQPLVDGSITPSRIDKNLVKDKGLIF
jgi:hypothetical protein